MEGGPLRRQAGDRRLEVFEKKTKQTPQDTIANCRRRYAAFKKEDTP